MTNTASKTILVTPVVTVVHNPSCGFSAATKKLWNINCSTVNGSAAKIMRAYTTQFSNSSPSAPSAVAMGRINTMPRMPKMTPNAIAVYTCNEKIRLAFSLSPSPKVLATSALPPVPKINPMVERIIRNGIMRLTAANGVFPAKLDTKYPSTTP